MDNVTEASAEHGRVGETLIAALAKRAFAELEACFHPEIRFRALTPPGVREASSAEQAAAYFRKWFGDAERLELVEGQTEALADRLHLRYRLLVVDADGRQVVEQQGYGDVQDGQIVRLDLLCSGFRPLPAQGEAALPAAAATLDAQAASSAASPAASGAIRPCSQRCTVRRPGPAARPSPPV